MSYKCDLCGKEEEFDNTVWYYDEEFNLCEKHVTEWNKHHKPYRLVHKQIKPCTDEWSEMCKEEEALFKAWLKEQKEGGK